MCAKNFFDIAIIEPVGGHGGMDHYDFGLCNGLTQAGLRVILYTCDETKNPITANYIIKKYFRNIYSKKHVLFRGIFFMSAIFKVFTDILFKSIPTVHFHFFYVGFLQFIIIFISKILGLNIIVTVHDVESLINKKKNYLLARITYNLCNKLVVHNDFSKAELLSRLKIESKKINVIPHGNYLHIYSKIINRKKAKTKFGVLPHEKVLLFFGQIKSVKRLDLLLSAFAKVLKEQPNTRLIIAGKVVDVPFFQYQAKINALGLTNNCICLIRYIKNKEVPLLFASSDMVVLPYGRIYQSGVLLMAMSFSRAAVVSDIPGMLDIVKDQDTGYVFQNGNLKALASCLLECLGDNSHREKIARNGFNMIKKNHDWELIGKLHAILYTSNLRR